MLRTTALALVFVSLAFGETQNGTVVSGGQPIPGATVTALCGTDKISTVTDDAGKFEVGGLTAAPCHFSVAMFGFDATPRDAAPSASPLSFDLRLQTRASLPSDSNAPAGGPQQAGGRQGGFRRQQNPDGASSSSSGAPPANGDAPQQTANGAGPGRGGPGGGGPGRGGFGRGQGRAGQGQQAANGQGRGPAGNTAFQNLSLVQNEDGGLPAAEGDVVPSLAGGGPDTSGANEAFLVNGTVSQGVVQQGGDFVGLNPGGFGPPGGQAGNPFGQQALNGGPGGPGDAGGAAGFGGPAGGGAPAGFGGGGRGGGGRGGGGGFAGGRGGRGGRGNQPNRNAQFGNRVGRNRGRQFQGNAFYTIGNSVLNARPYSFTAGVEPVKAGYASNRFGISIGGPLMIPHLFTSDKTFLFINYTGSRSKNGVNRATTVPTLDQRNAAIAALGPSRVDAASLSLLQLIPLPNALGIRNNYQLIASAPSNNDNLQVRVNQTLTSRDRLDVNFNYQHRDAQNYQTFGFVDPSNGNGLNSSVTWGRTFNRNLINSLVFSFSRNVNRTLSSFAYGEDLEGNLGITGVTTNPLFYGPPTISFTNFGSLTDVTPSLTRAQTSGVTDTLTFIHGKHTLAFGAGFQRRQNNVLSNNNARGTYNFTGLISGDDLQDFLVGLPQSTSVATYADPSRYLRESTGNLYVSDDWRPKSNLSFTTGLRWEYFGPYYEKHGHMANLDYAPGFTNVAVVPAGGTGPYSGSFPDGLINSDWKLFSPRFGVAWRPIKGKQIVVRGGYGIYYNGGVYSQFGTQMAAQPPFASTFNLQTTTATPLTLQNGFPAVLSTTIANTFSVDKNYTPGYAQSWNLSIQESLGRSWQVSIAYNGIKGTNLDVLRIPNRAPLGSPLLNAQNLRMIPTASAFTFDDSIGNSIYHAGQVSFTRRFARGASFSLQYTLSKAIDDTSTLGGGPVQNDASLVSERALSPNDQRHNLRLNYNFQSPVPANRSGLTADLLRGWTIGGTMTATSGTPFTALVTGDPSGTGFTGNSRAQATGLPVTSGTGYFNTAAFTIPTIGTFGNAARDTIPGISNFSLNASLFRTFRLDDRRRLQIRIDTTNPLNHVSITQINTIVGSVAATGSVVPSINYGIPTGANPMRTVTATVRLNF